jgi:hypothetical protein
MADVIDTLAAAVATAASQSEITFVGELERNARKAGPRVVWVPRGGKVTPPVQDEDDNSKSCYEYGEGCDVYFLASTREDARNLMHAFLSGLFTSQSHWSVRPDDYEHSIETLSGLNRHEIRLRVEADITVQHETYYPRSVDTTTQTGTITD